MDTLLGKKPVLMIEACGSAIYSYERFGVIYILTNKINHKKYVGQTTRGFNVRFLQHKRSKNSLIGRALRKYGEDNFLITIEVLEKCLLDEREQKYISLHNCIFPNGYNLDSGGCLNKKHSQETRKKIGIAHINSGLKPPSQKGKRRSLETRAKISNAQLGKKRGPRPDEVKKKISDSKKNISIETKNRISIALTGRHHSELAKQKMSEARKRYLKLEALTNV